MPWWAFLKVTTIIILNVYFCVIWWQKWNEVAFFDYRSFGETKGCYAINPPASYRTARSSESNSQQFASSQAKFVSWWRLHACRILMLWLWACVIVAMILVSKSADAMLHFVLAHWLAMKVSFCWQFALTHLVSRCSLHVSSFADRVIYRPKTASRFESPLCILARESSFLILQRNSRSAWCALILTQVRQRVAQDVLREIQK